MDKVYEALDKIPEQIRYVIVFAICGLIVSLYVFLVRFPAQDELKRLGNERQQVSTTYQSKKAIADDLQNWQLEVQRLQVLLEEALNQLPEDIDTDQLLINVPNIAKKNGLEVKEFSIENERRKSGYAEVPMSLKISGTFRGIGGFAQEIGDQPRIMAVKDLKMKKSAKQSTPNVGAANSGSSADVDDGVGLDIEAEVVTYRFLSDSKGSSGNSRQRAKR